MIGTTTYLSLGSNLGDRKLNLENAITLIADHIGCLEAVSRIYQSAAWGYDSKNPYYNCCLKISIPSSRDPLSIIDRILKIEESLGRTRDPEEYSDRLIDIDILLFGDRVIDHPRLTVPHPRMNLRRFVLVPLAEIAPEETHPVSGKTIRELLKDCEDLSEVELVL